MHRPLPLRTDRGEKGWKGRGEGGKKLAFPFPPSFALIKNSPSLPPLLLFLLGVIAIGRKKEERPKGESSKDGPKLDEGKQKHTQKAKFAECRDFFVTLISKMLSQFIIIFWGEFVTFRLSFRFLFTRDWGCCCCRRRSFHLNGKKGKKKEEEEEKESGSG